MRTISPVPCTIPYTQRKRMKGEVNICRGEKNSIFYAPHCHELGRYSSLTVFCCSKVPSSTHTQKGGRKNKTFGQCLDVTATISIL